MKATLEFNLPEDEREFDLAAKSTAISIAIREFDNSMRNALKYNATSFNTTEEMELVERIRQELHRKFIDYGVAFVFD